MSLSSCEHREGGRKYESEHEQDANVYCNQCVVVDTVAESIQNVNGDHKLHDNHNSNNEDDKVLDALSCVVYLNAIRFIPGFFRAKDILRCQIRSCPRETLKHSPSRVCN